MTVAHPGQPQGGHPSGAEPARPAFRAGLVLAVVALLGLLVFALQNRGGAETHFLWMTWSPPVFEIILASFIVGAGAGGLAMTLVRRRRLARATARARSIDGAAHAGGAYQPPLTEQPKRRRFR